MNIDHLLLAVSTSTTIGTWAGVALLLRQRHHQRQQWERANETANQLTADEVKTMTADTVLKWQAEHGNGTPVDYGSVSNV